MTKYFVKPIKTIMKVIFTSCSFFHSGLLVTLKLLLGELEGSDSKGITALLIQRELRECECSQFTHEKVNIGGG